MKESMIHLGISNVTRNAFRSTMRIPFNTFRDTEAFARVLGKRPPSQRLAFIMSALELSKVSRLVPVLGEGNHVLRELKAFYLKYGSDTHRIETGIDYALNMMAGDKHDLWAGIVACSAIPIPKGHPKLLNIGEVLVDTILTSPHWPNVEAATHTALALKDILPQETRRLIAGAALQVKLGYEELIPEAVAFGGVYNSPQAIVANLNSIIENIPL
jgi:hypothetical protein